MTEQEAILIAMSNLTERIKQRINNECRKDCVNCGDVTIGEKRYDNIANRVLRIINEEASKEEQSITEPEYSMNRNPQTKLITGNKQKVTVSNLEKVVKHLENDIKVLRTDRDYWKVEAQKDVAKLGEIRILLGDV